jgi:uncharacterized protein (TIGR00369 family)
MTHTDQSNAVQISAAGRGGWMEVPVEVMPPRAESYAVDRHPRRKERAEVAWGQARIEDHEIWQEPARGGFVDALQMGVPWRDVLRMIHEGRAPQPPIAHLSGRRLVDLKEGEATLALPASDWFRGPKGHLDTGMSAFLADMAHFYAVLSTLPPGAACTTAELSLTFLGQPPAGGGEITAQSRVIHADERTALAVGSVVGQEGQPVAYSTSRYFLFPPRTAMPPRPVSSPQAPVVPRTPGPLSRRCGPTTSPLDEETMDRLSGLEILQAQIAGAMPRPPLDQLTGIRLTDASDGQVRFSLPAHGWLPQEMSTVFGGMIALLAKSAAAGAVQAVAGAGTRFAALDLKVNFLRPVPADGGELLATGTVTHRGRHLTIATADVLHGGRRVATATGTTALTAPHGSMQAG